MRNIFGKRFFLSVLFLVFVVLFATQCTRAFEKYRIYPHYITCCGPARDFSVNEKFKAIHIVGTEKRYNFFLINFNMGEPKDNDLVNYPNKETLDYLNSIGDNGYRGKREGVFPESAYGLRYPITHISITSDRDLSEDYPAGSELNRLFKLGIVDNYSYIKSGYAPNLEKNRIEIEASNSERLRETLVPGPNMYFYMLEYPQAWSNRGVKFTLSFSFEDGTKLEKTFVCFIPEENEM